MQVISIVFYPKVLLQSTAAGKFSAFSAIQITIPELNPQDGAPLKEYFFGAFKKDGCLCVMECLREYERRTLEFQKQCPEVADPLFLSYVRPHKPVTSQRIAHWIKDLLQLAGVDTAVFSAHSVRGASTAAAVAKGIHVADILAVADWSRGFIIAPPQMLTMHKRS